MRVTAYLICAALATGFYTSAQEQGLDKTSFKDSISLFNGTDFEGWEIIKGDKRKGNDLFSVEDGIIHVYGSQPDKTKQPFGGIQTNDSYENYVLTLEYKWGEKKFEPRQEYVRDAGILFHVFGESTIWPSSAECQIQEGDTGDLWLIGARGSSTVDTNNHHYSPTGETFTRGGEAASRFQSFTRSFYWEKTGWNVVEIEVVGASAKFKVNGQLVNEVLNLEHYDETSKKFVPLNKGKILLQAEGAEVYYRNIVLKTL